MAAVMAPLDEVEEIVAGIDGYVVLANINSTHQVVLGGATEAVAQGGRGGPAARAQRDPAPGQPRLPHRDRGAGERAAARDAPAAGPARARSCRSSPTSPASSIRPATALEEQMLDMLGRQVASPVQFVEGPAHALRRGRAGLRRDRARSTRCRASPPTCSATTRSSAWPPTTPSTATCRRSTTRCAACGPRAWAPAGSRSRARHAQLRAGATAQPQPRAAPGSAQARRASATPTRSSPLAESRAPAWATGDGARADGAGGHHRRGARPPGRRAAVRRRPRRRGCSTASRAST